MSEFEKVLPFFLLKDGEKALYSGYCNEVRIIYGPEGNLLLTEVNPRRILFKRVLFRKVSVTDKDGKQVGCMESTIPVKTKGLLPDKGITISQGKIPPGRYFIPIEAPDVFPIK